MGGRLSQGATGAMQDCHDEEDKDEDEGRGEPRSKRDAETGEQGQETEAEGAVALAHGPVVAAGGADLQGDEAGDFRDDGEGGGEDDEACVKAGDEGERQVEGGVGDDVLVEVVGFFYLRWLYAWMA